MDPPLGWQSDQELKWLARGALVVESDILEIYGSHPSSNGPEWEPRLSKFLPIPIAPPHMGAGPAR